MGRKRKKKNQNKTIGIIILILAAFLYAKMTVLKDFNPIKDFDFGNIKFENPFKKNIEVTERSITEDYSEVKDEEPTTIKEEDVYVNIFFTRMNNGKDVYVAVSRKKPSNYKGSDVEYAVRSLVAGPTKYEQKQGVYTEIPPATKLVSFRELPSRVNINLSDDFEYGGGGDSLYKRMYQLIKTVNHNTRKPVYLYLNGKYAEMIGGEGLMLRQPLRSNSLEE